ncbi:MAG: TRAP transporter fused permease subunit [Deltaproteobacteria bacterium]|nr:TRAP transporter fused permease subunit [Deltaproteobacteria bacterium]
MEKEAPVIPAIPEDESFESRFRKLPRYFNHLAAFIAMLFVGFHLYTGLMGRLPALQQRIIHVTLGWMLVWLLVPVHARLRKNRLAFAVDFLMMLVSLGIGIYVYHNFTTYFDRVGMPILFVDLLLGTTAIIFTVELARRTVGWFFFAVVAGFLVFAFWGPYMPNIVAHRGLSLTKMVSSFFLTTGGIYGMITGVSATYIALFIILAAMIRESGVGDLFIKISMSLLGTVRGGPAKMAIVASSLFGIFTGSSIANVAATGSFTIPLMKRTGYKPFFAGAVEAVSSSGAQLMPPVMGGSVFIMIEILGIAYWDVAKAALLIAILFYLALFAMVDFEALKLGLLGLPREQLPSFRKAIKEEGHLILPVIILIYLLAVADVSPPRAAVITIFSIPLSSWLRRSTRMTFRMLFSGLKSGAYGSLIIIGVICAASLIQGIVDRTALGFNLSTMLVDVSGGHLLLLLFLTMITSLILGMGLPAMICYILLAVLVAPALVQMGVDPLGAHLFIFYFGILSNITPPVAPDAYVAASIAGANMLKTAVTASRLGLVLYLIPFLLVYNPELMMKGSMSVLLGVFISATIGTYLLACSLQGYILRDWKISVPERLILLAAALGLIKPGLYTDLIGFGLAVAVVGFRFIKLRGTGSKATPTGSQSP